MNRPLVRVVKVGGSLLDDPRLRHRLNDWLVRQPPALNVFIAGGGELAEFVRRIDEIFGIGHLKAHWLSIDLMSVTARILVELIDDARVETDFELLTPSISNGAQVAPIVFDARDFLRSCEPNYAGYALPQDESVTSDSIAARIAEIMDADELVLLKSDNPSPNTTFDELAAAGYVDPCFPHIARRLRSVRLVNLRGIATDKN